MFNSDDYEIEIKTFGELEVGDLIPDENGNPVAVKTTYDKHLPKKMFKIEMENGTIVKASGNHLFYVEPDVEKIGHFSRLERARLFLKDAPEELLSGLEKVALSEEVLETTVEEMISLLDYSEDYAAAHELVSRICSSVGWILEETQTNQDMITGGTISQDFEKIYDCKMIARQLLSLTGKRKFKKLWPVKVGRVVTTEELYWKYPDTEILSAF